MTVENSIEALYDLVAEIQSVISSIENADTYTEVEQAGIELEHQAGTIKTIVGMIEGISNSDEWFALENSL